MRNSGTRVKGRGGDVTKEEKFGVMQILAFQMEPRKERSFYKLEKGKEFSPTTSRRNAALSTP